MPLKRTRTLLLLPFLVLMLFPGKAMPQKFGIMNMPRYDETMFHFGFVLGVDLSYLRLRPISDLNTRIFDSTYIPDILPLPDSARVLSIESTPVPGFVISIVSNMRLGKYFDLRFIPSLAFGDRSILYTVQFFHNGDTTVIPLTKQVPSTYINLPLEVRFKSERYNNFRAYLMAGVQYTLDLASQAKRREQKNRDQKIVKFKRDDIYLEGGAGFEFYNEWFKFGIELKMMYGMFDILQHENNIYTEGISGLKSKIFQVSLTFE